MYPVFTFVVIFLLVNTSSQQNIGREQEICTAVQTNDVLEKALPLIRRHLEVETESCKHKMDQVNVKLSVSLEAVQAELESTKQHNNDMNVSLEAVRAELESTKRRNNDMNVSLEAVQAELESTKQRNNDMNVSLEAVQAELESTKQRNNDMNVSLEAVRAELETTKQRNNHMNVSLESVQAELETMKKHIQELKATKWLTSCSDLSPGSPSGVYRMTLTPGRSDDVYCDMDTDGGPWTVIQNRQDGTVDFYRNWTEYQTGFGDLDGEFWAGLDIIHLLTLSGSILRIDLMSWKNDVKYAQYRDFRVGDASSKYRLSVSGFSGNVSVDAMEHNDGHQFSTYDKENDVWRRNCVVYHHGAWWYGACSESNLNGPYVQDTGDNDYQSMYWWEFYSGRNAVPMMKSRMMVKHPGV